MECDNAKENNTKCEKGEKMENKSDISVKGMKCMTDENGTVSMKFNLMFDPVDIGEKEKFIAEETAEGYNVKYITVDNEPESPRQCDNFGIMVCFHRRYSLGDIDEDHCYRGEDYNSWEELKNEIEKKEDVGVILPLYLYDHSGITMKTCPFNDRWDSGQVGFIFVSKAKIREEFSIEDMSVDITDDILDGAKKILEGEVEIYDCYLTGEVYRLVKEKFDKDKQQIDYDIVGGYYGMEHTKEELKCFKPVKLEK
jgi:hypothetical protein